MEKEENSIFVEYFGKSPYIKVLDFLITGQEFDYSMTEVATGARVGWSAFTRVWKQLLDKQIIAPTREIGNAKLFRLNKKNPFVENLIKFDLKLIKYETDKLFKEHEGDKEPKALKIKQIA